MGYRVKFINPETGAGFVDHYRTARSAKAVAAAYQAQFEKDGGKGVRAEYIGWSTGGPGRINILGSVVTPSSRTKS